MRAWSLRPLNLVPLLHYILYIILLKIGFHIFSYYCRLRINLIEAESNSHLEREKTPELGQIHKRLWQIFEYWASVFVSKHQLENQSHEAIRNTIRMIANIQCNSMKVKM